MALTVNPRAIQIREPNLLVPGKKPVGAVRVDWSHPLARGLKGALLISHKDKRAPYRTIGRVSHEVQVTTEATGDPIVIKNGLAGLHIHPYTPSIGPKNPYIADDGFWANDSDITIIQWITVTAWGTDGSLIYRGPFNNDSFRLAISSQTNFQTALIDSSPAGYQSDVTLDSLSVNDYLVVCGRKRGTEVQAFALQDGVFKTGTPDTASSATMRNSSTDYVYFAGNNGGGDGSYILHSAYLYDAAVSRGGIEALMRDPYSILIPA